MTFSLFKIIIIIKVCFCRNDSAPCKFEKDLNLPWKDREENKITPCHSPSCLHIYIVIELRLRCEHSAVCYTLIKKKSHHPEKALNIMFQNLNLLLVTYWCICLTNNCLSSTYCVSGSDCVLGIKGRSASGDRLSLENDICDYLVATVARDVKKMLVLWPSQWGQGGLPRGDDRLMWV